METLFTFIYKIYIFNYRNRKLSARFAHMNGLWKTLHSSDKKTYVFVNFEKKITLEITVPHTLNTCLSVKSKY